MKECEMSGAFGSACRKMDGCYGKLNLSVYKDSAGDFQIPSEETVRSICKNCPILEEVLIYRKELQEKQDMQ